ncbi:MAG: hypothetical protein Q9227_002274 [Pyrenula ochraceoflavens]
MDTTTPSTDLNGEASTVQNHPVTAADLQKQYEESHYHKPTVEETVDEDDPAPLKASKQASKLDTQSEEAFPSLGSATKGKAPVGAATTWGARKTPAPPKNPVNGNAGIPPKQAPATSQSSSRASTPASGIAPTSTWANRQAGPTVMAMPGKVTHECSIASEEINKDKPIKPLLDNVSRKLGVMVTTHTSPGEVVFRATGSAHAVDQALKQIAGALSSNVTKKVRVPAAARKHIIGAKGANVQNLMKKTGTTIQIPKPQADEDESTEVDIEVEGNSRAAALAIQEIDKIAAEHAAKVNLQMKEVPPEFFPFIAGPKNQRINALRNGQNLDIHVPQYHTWSSQPPPMAPRPGERPAFASHPNHAIRIAGERRAAQQAQAQIEREVERLRQNLTVHQEYFSPGQPQFIVGDRGLSLHDFLEETGCAVVLPAADAEDSETVTIVGPPDRLQAGIDKAVNLASEMQSANIPLGRYHGNAPQGAEAHARNLTRYLQRRRMLEQLEQAHNTHIVAPQRFDSPVAWNIFSREGRSMQQARSDIIRIVEAHPPSRISQVNVNPFFYPHLSSQIAQPLQEELHVNMVVPHDEETEHLILVYEGPEGLDPSFQVPRQRPSAREMAQFETNLQQAMDRIMNMIGEHEHIVATTTPAPRKYHDKLRRYVDRQQQSIPPGSFPVQLEFANQGPQTRTANELDPNNVLLRGPAGSVEQLKRNIAEFIDQQEKEEAERGYTVSFEFPLKHISQLVGREGSSINKLRDDFDVDIFVGDGKDGKVTVKGPQSKAEKCKSHIISLGKKLEDEETYVIKVPSQFHGELIGPKGSNVNKLQDKYHVRIQFPRNNEAGADDASESGIGRGSRSRPATDEITIRGPRKGANDARGELLDLKQYIEDNSYTETVSVARAQIRSLVGKGGREIEQLRQETGAIIDLPNQARDDNSSRVEIKLKGAKKDVQKARQILQQKSKSFDDIVTQSVDVDRKYYKDIIGSGGSNVRRLVVEAGGQEQDARNVKFPEPRDESSAIKVSGPEPLVKKIVANLQAFVSDRANQVRDTIEVPVAKRRNLIGREGQTRQSIESQYHVSVIIPRQGDQSTSVEIIGSPENVAKAKEHIASLTKSPAGEILPVPRAIHHAVADRGNLFRQLRNNHNVTVDHSGEKPPPRLEAPAGNRSRSRPTNGATPLITDDPVTAAESYLWDIVEHDPSTSSESGTIPWVLSGPSPESIAAAKATIERAMARANQPSTKGFLILPESTSYGAIIGPGGSKINEIRRETGCDVQVPKNGNKEAIEVSGGKDECEKAREMILDAVRQAGESRRR